jgi:vitamin B12 transporter
MSRLSARPHSADLRAFGRVPTLPVSLSLLLGGVTAAGHAAAQSASFVASTRLSEVVVTGTRTPMRVDDNIADVTVIDRAQIEQATGRTLPELLAQQAGIQFSSNGGLGKSSSVSLRGLESRHTLLLIDGVRYGSATLGTPVWENIPIEAIERIEIVRGPMSGLYGSDAVGGVVQIFTRHGADGAHVNASTTLGPNRYGQATGGVRFGQGAFDSSVQFQHTETRGFSSTNDHAQFGNFNPDDDGFRQNSGTVQLGWRFADGWRADARVLHSEGVTQYDDGASADSRAGLRTEALSVAVSGPVNKDWRSTVRAARSTDDYDTLATASAFTALGRIGTVQQQLAWENTLATPIGAAVLLAEHLHQSVSRPGTAFTVSERSIDGVAAGLSGSAGVHSWQANLRHDRNSQFGSENTGMLAYGLALSSAWRAAASYGTSFVAPSFNQLYYPGFGNPNLLPEEGKQAELSLRWAAAGHQVRAAYFDNRIRGYISSGPLPTNIPRTRIDGVSLSYDGQVDNWTFAASADHVDPRNDTPGATFGKQLPRRAKNSVKASADVSFGAWSLGGSANAFNHRFDNAANTLRVAGYGTLDLRADWHVAREWTLGLRLNNVGDKAYETVYGYNQPGREADVTLRYSGL